MTKSKDGGKGGEATELISMSMGEAETVKICPHGNEAGTEQAREDKKRENDRPSQLKEEEQLGEGEDKLREKNSNTEEDGIIDIAETEVTDPGEEKER